MIRIFRACDACLLFLYLVIIPGCLLALPATAAQQPADSSQQRNTAYETQRNKVNELLDQRSARFGQFNESLQQRTGIFGLKTKKDMQASLDILQQIVLTDNDIFKETKRLLDFKDFENLQVTEQASEFDGRINGYIKTISKLQQEQQRLHDEIHALRQNNKRYIGFALLTAILFIVVVFVARGRKKLTKA